MPHLRLPWWLGVTMLLQIFTSLLVVFGCSQLPQPLGVQVCLFLNSGIHIGIRFCFL